MTKHQEHVRFAPTQSQVTGGQVGGGKWRGPGLLMVIKASKW